MSNVTVGLLVDTVQAQLAIQDVMKMSKEATEKWKADRRDIMTGIRQTMTHISSLMMSFRMAMSLIGESIDPFFSTLIGMVISTVSMLISVGSGMVATGIGAAAGAVVIGIAIALNLLTTAKLVADQLEIKTDFTALRESLAGAITAGQQTPQGFGF